MGEIQVRNFTNCAPLDYMLNTTEKCYGLESS